MVFILSKESHLCPSLKRYVHPPKTRSSNSPDIQQGQGCSCGTLLILISVCAIRRLARPVHPASRRRAVCRRWLVRRRRAVSRAAGRAGCKEGLSRDDAGGAEAVEVGTLRYGVSRRDGRRGKRVAVFSSSLEELAGTVPYLWENNSPEPGWRARPRLVHTSP